MNERQRTILSRLAEQKEIRVKHLIQTLGVSGVTVRQDLEYLQSQGFIERPTATRCSAAKMKSPTA